MTKANQVADPEDALPHVDYHQVGSKNVIRRKPLTPKRLAIVSCLVILPVALFCLIQFTDFFPHEPKKDDPLVGVDFPRCTFEELYTAYHPAAKKYKRYGPAGNNSETCWDLQDEVMRVPAHAIHRHHLIRLGNGFRGAVFKAIIKLPHGKQCLAAVKTDHCNTLNSGISTKQTRHSCLEPHSFSLNKDSFMAGEYTGTAMFYALRRMDPNSTHASHGLLPTWGLVQDFGHPIRATHKRSELDGLPHPDGTIKGSIMPLVDFEPLYSIDKNIFRNVSAIVDTFIPAAEGLQLIHSMGLTSRDVSPKNIGVTKVGQDRYRAFIFDYSYLAIVNGQECLLPEDQKEGCDFCQDRVMFRTDDYEGGAPRDSNALRDVVVNLLRDSPESSDEKQDLIDKLQQCRAAQEVATVLREWQ